MKNSGKIIKDYFSIATLLRVVVSIIIATHGWHRLLEGSTGLFAEWLASQGIPLAIVVAWFVTLTEVVGSPLLALGILRRPLAATYILIYLCGLFMAHLPSGWFVVGAGRNGIEYSTLLITTLIFIGFSSGQLQTSSQVPESNNKPL